MRICTEVRRKISILLRLSQHQRQSTHVHGLGQNESDGCGVGVPHELRPPILQGEGGTAEGDLLRILTTNVRQQDMVFFEIGDFDVLTSKHQTW